MGKIVLNSDDLKKIFEAYPDPEGLGIRPKTVYETEWVIEGNTIELHLTPKEENNG